MADIHAATRGNITVQAMQRVLTEETVERSAAQEESHDAFLNQIEEMVNPFAARFQTKQKQIKNRHTRVQKTITAGEKGERLAPVERIKDSADQFQRRNPELKARILLLLREYIKPGDSKEEILKKVLEFYQDVSLADEALEFLLETSEGELYQNIQAAKEELNAQHGREITAGRNMGQIARQAAETTGIGTATSLRDMYRDITGNPRDCTTLFDELSSRYSFDQLKKVASFLFHSLGADLRAKGPSIPHGLLHRLLSETRSLQAILGVYNFFRIRMKLVGKLFTKNDLKMPQQLTFEQIAKQFISFVSDRYPSSDKALQLAVKLGIEKWLIAKIIVLSQLRDAIREVAVNQIFKSIQHRDDSYAALIEALEELEDELEELEERDEEGGDEGGGGSEEQEEQEENKKIKKVA